MQEEVEAAVYGEMVVKEKKIGQREANGQTRPIHQRIISAVPELHERTCPVSSTTHAVYGRHSRLQQCPYHGLVCHTNVVISMKKEKETMLRRTLLSHPPNSPAVWPGGGSRQGGEGSNVEQREGMG